MISVTIREVTLKTFDIRKRIKKYFTNISPITKAPNSDSRKKRLLRKICAIRRNQQLQKKTECIHQ